MLKMEDHVTLEDLKNGGFLSNPLDLDKALFDISVNTVQIGMGFEGNAPGKI